MHKLFLLKITLICLIISTLIGCSYKNNENPTKQEARHRPSKSTNLSLYGVCLGSPLDSLLYQIPNIAIVPIDSLNKSKKFSLPYDLEEAKLIFEYQGISLYRTDTIFIADHKNYQHHTKDGFYADFPLEKVRHNAVLCYMIKNNRVLECEIYIGSTICGYDNINLSSHDFRGTIEKMYYDKYQEPDSIFMINKRTNRAVFVGYNEDKVIKSEIYEQLGGFSERYNIFKEDVWIWSNAKISADWNFKPFRHGQRWYWGPANIIKISYVDLAAINEEKNIILRNLEKERQDSIKRIQQKQLEDINRYNTQDI